MSNSFETLKKNILYTKSKYIKDFTPKPYNVPKGEFTYDGDPKDENMVEKIIRNLKSELEFGIENDQPIDMLSRYARTCVLGEKNRTAHPGNDGEIIEEIRSSTISLDDKKAYYHNGYIEYILCAWKNHFGIEVAPWHFWYTIIWSLKETNKHRPEIFRSLWTTSDKKIDISFIEESPNIHKIYYQLSKHIPKKTLDAVITRFPSEQPLYYESLLGLVGEISKDYYDIFVLSCDIPKVIVRGTKEEWEHLVKSIKKLYEIYKPLNDTYVDEYFSKVIEYVESCCKMLDNKEFWLKFFKIHKCGSGSQDEISGHIKELFCNNTILLANIPQMTSNFPFTLVDKESEIKTQNFFRSGIFKSTLNDENVLVPEYHNIHTRIKINIINEKKIMSKNNLIRSMELLNSYYRSPILNYEINDNVFVRIFEESNMVLGAYTQDQIFEIMKIKHGHNNMYISNDKKGDIKLIPVDFPEKNTNIMKRNIANVAEKNKGKTLLDLYYEILDKRDMSREHRNNFWFNGTTKTQSVDGQKSKDPVITTEMWLRGRRRQTEDDIKLICEQLIPIVKCFKKNNIHGHLYNGISLADLVLSTYNENIYKSFVDQFSAFDISSKFLVSKKIMDCVLPCDEMSNPNDHREVLLTHLLDKLLYTTTFVGDLSSPASLYLIKQLVNMISPEYFDKVIHNLGYLRLLPFIKNKNEILDNDIYFNQSKKQESGLLHLINNLSGKELMFNGLVQQFNILRNMVKSFDDHIKSLTQKQKYSNDLVNQLLKDNKYTLQVNNVCDPYNIEYLIIRHGEIVQLPLFIKEFLVYIFSFTCLFKQCDDHKTPSNNFWYEGEIIEEEEYVGSVVEYKYWIDKSRFDIKIQEQKVMNDDIIKEFDLIYQFLLENDKVGNIFQKNILYTLNLDLYESFFVHYQKNPYPISIYDFPVFGCYQIEPIFVCFSDILNDKTSFPLLIFLVIQSFQESLGINETKYLLSPDVAKNILTHIVKIPVVIDIKEQLYDLALHILKQYIYYTFDEYKKHKNGDRKQEYIGSSPHYIKDIIFVQGVFKKLLLCVKFISDSFVLPKFTNHSLNKIVNDAIKTLCSEEYILENDLVINYPDLDKLFNFVHKRWITDGVVGMDGTCFDIDGEEIIISDQEDCSDDEFRIIDRRTEIIYKKHPSISPIMIEDFTEESESEKSDDNIIKKYTYKPDKEKYITNMVIGESSQFKKMNFQIRLEQIARKISEFAKKKDYTGRKNVTHKFI